MTAGSREHQYAWVANLRAVPGTLQHLAAWECLECGALVVDQPLHNRWHEALTPQESLEDALRTINRRERTND